MARRAGGGRWAPAGEREDLARQQVSVARGVPQGRIWRGSGRQNSGSEGRAVETSSLPNAKYAAVSILARIRLREEEIVSLFSTLFPY